MESQPQNPELTLYLIETPFNTFTNRTDLDQAVFSEQPDQGLLFLPIEIWYIWSYTSGPVK